MADALSWICNGHIGHLVHYVGSGVRYIRKQSGSSPEWQEDTVADEHTQTPYDGDSHADVVEVIVGASQKVPGSQLFWSESLRDFVLHNALYAFLAKIKDVTERKVSPVERVWMRAPQFPDLFFHRTIVLLDNSYNDQ